MKAIFTIVIITAAIALLEIPSLIKQSLGREFLIFVALLVFTFTIGIMQSLKMDISNPFDWITFIFNPMTEIIQRILE